MGSQDQRKHTLEALERRFAVAEAEIFQNQKKDKPKSNRGSVRDPDGYNAASASPLERPCDVAGTHTGAADPTHSQLNEAIHENLSNTNIEGSGERGTRFDGFLHELLKKGDLAHKYIQGSRSLKV